ncbi:MAG: mucoidy inhibitor MuiA family protein [Bacteroidales bacterium]
MKSLIISSLLLLLTATAGYGSVEKEIQSEIKHVTLFPDRAQISSEAGISASAGETVLMLKGLSPYIIRSTIQVSGEGRFTIMGVSHSNNFLEATGDSPEVKDLKSKIEVLNGKVEDEKTAIEVLRERENFLVANRVITGKDGTLTAEQYRAMLELYSSNIDQVRTTVLKKTRLIRDYEKQLQDLNNQLNQSMGKRRLPTGEIAVTISAPAAVTGKLMVSYVVTNAGWTPSYDIRVEDTNKPVALVYKANVFQSTGNDWKGVRLSFTNASPSESGEIPVLNPWYLSFYQPPELMLRGKAAGVAARSQPAADKVEEVEYFAMAAEAPEVMITQGITAVSFDVTVPSDILSDGRTKTIEIGSTTTTASYVRESVPKLDAKAYLTGRIAEWENLNIIGGEANLYFENRFVGNSWLSPAQFGDTMKISLGSDRGITIKRERQVETTARRFLGNNRIDTRSFMITVRNNKGETVAIKISDQIPVSTNSDITVEATQISGGNLDTVSGMVTWEFNLEPQQSRDLVLTYTVKYPKEKVIILE